LTGLAGEKVSFFEAAILILSPLARAVSEPTESSKDSRIVGNLIQP